MSRGWLRPAVLARAMTSPPARVGLPADWLVAPGDATLSLDLPMAQVQHRLADWLQTDGLRVHASDHFLLAGDWSGIRRPIRDSRVYAEVADLRAYGDNFRDSPSYRAYCRSLSRGRPARRAHARFVDEQAVTEYFQRCLAMLRGLEQLGFVSRREALALGPARAGFARWRSRWWDWLDHDLNVAIDAGGEVLRLPGGQHRTAMALQLGLPTLPVVVRVVHPQWLAGHMQAGDMPAWTALRQGVARLAGP